MLNFDADFLTSSSTAVTLLFPTEPSSLSQEVVLRYRGATAKVDYIWFVQVITRYRKPLSQFVLLHHGM